MPPRPARQAILKGSVTRDDTGWVDASGSARSDTDREFAIVRKGYDPAEVDKRLAEYEEAMHDLEVHAARLKHELKEARRRISQLEDAEKESVDRAMLAVFDAKERILERALERAREIEDQARLTAGLPVAPPGDGAGRATTGAPEQTVATPVPGLSGAVGPETIMQRMLDEAEAIRNRLDKGVAAAFAHMEEMQRVAESRAADLIADVRQEAAQLRSTAAEKECDGEPLVTVNLSGEGQPTAERPSRYSRNTAHLPRLGDNGGPSVLASLNGLRSKMRESDESPDG